MRRALSRIGSQQASVASLGSAALVAFLLLVGLESWQGYEQAETELKADIAAHARLMSEHVERTFQTVEIAFDAVNAALDARPWDDVAGSRAFHQRIRGLAAQVPQVRSIWLTDQNGAMRVFSERWPSPPLDAFEREYFAVHAIEGVAGLHLGRPLLGRFTGRPFIPVSLPLLAERFSFRGVITAAVEPDYYLPLLSAHGGCGICTTALFRPDGEILFTTGEAPGLEPALVDGVSRLIVSEAYPIVIAVWAPRAAIAALWWEREQDMLLAAAAAAALLCWLLLRAVRASRTVAAERDRLAQLTGALTAKNDELDEARGAAEASRRLEQRLRQEAAAANLAKSEFLALMSHELRTPLNAVIGFAEIIRDRRPDFPPERITEYAADIHGSGRHLLSLINGILDLSKIEAGKFDLAEDSVDLQALVEEAVRMVAGRFAEKQLTIERRVDAAAVRADERALRQVLVNLLSNAGKFTEPGGRIAIASELDADWVSLVIADEGCGMTPEELARAREPFGQAMTPLVRRSEGSGLGLNITEALVQLHGGRVDIDSEAGVGTRVAARLPRWRLEASAEAVAAQ